MSTVPVFGMIDTVLVGLDVANHKQHEHESTAYRDVKGGGELSVVYGQDKEAGEL